MAASLKSTTIVHESEETEGNSSPLNRQVAVYALARGAPGVLNFLALSLYTRLLDTNTFGEYALAISVVSLVSSIAFYWLEIGLVRFYSDEALRPTLLATILRGFVWASCVSCIGMVAITVSSGLSPTLLLIATTLLLAQSWHNLQLQLLRARLQPRRYARVAIARSIIAPTVGAVLAALGMGAAGLLLGLASGALLSSLLGTRANWISAVGAVKDARLTRALIAYGGPLTVVFALRFIVNSSDRFMIAHFLDMSATGVYSAAVELAGNSIGFLTTIVQLGAFPLILRAYEQGGSKLAAVHYRQNITLLLTVTMPAAAGLVLLAPQIARVIFPPEFANQTSTLIPWLATAALISVIKSAGFDVTFHLTRRTTLQMLVILLAAAANIILNYFFIPRSGTVGAAKASIITHTLALGGSVLLGSRLIHLPFPFFDFARVLGATGVMSASLLPTLSWQGPFALPLQVCTGIVSFAIGSACLNLRPARSLLRFVAWPRKRK